MEAPRKPLPAIEFDADEKPWGFSWDSDGKELGTNDARDVCYRLVNLDSSRYSFKVSVQALLQDGDWLILDSANHADSQRYLARMVTVPPKGECEGGECFTLRPPEHLPHLIAAQYDLVVRVELAGVTVAERRLKRAVKFGRRRRGGWTSARKVTA